MDQNTATERSDDKSLQHFTIGQLGGGALDLRVFEGKVVLVVNVASECGLTPQYEGLQGLHDKYSQRGFSVLGIPCNQFGGQEPGNADQIQTFCETRFGVTFPMAEKVEVNGNGRHPLYAWMTSMPTTPEGPGDISWNFEKFLVGKDGRVLARFSPRTEPQSDEVIAAIEAAL